MNKQGRFLAVILLALCFAAAATSAVASSKTLPAKSLIFPMDPCWQPNKECFSTTPTSTVNPSTATYQVNTKRCPEYPNYAYGKNAAGTNLHTECDSDLNDQGIFQTIGFLYDVLKLGIPVYWVINPNKEVEVDGAFSAPDTADTKGRHAVDFSISKSGTDASVQIKHSAAYSDSGSTSPVKYRGGPFVIDINDINALDATKKAQFYTYLDTEYPSMKYHISNYDFTVPVDKVMSGVPPQVAVLGAGSTSILLSYLKASGLGSRVFDIFSTVSTNEVIAGGLDDYQLLWAPHWVIDDGCGEKCSTSGACPAGYTLDSTNCSTWPANCYKAAQAASCTAVQNYGNGYVIDTSKCSSWPNYWYKSGKTCKAMSCASGVLDKAACPTGPNFCSIPASPGACTSPNCSTGSAVVDTTQCSGNSGQSPVGQNICYYSNYASGCKITPTDQASIMSKVRGFLEKGNAGFFECASVNSMEGAREYDGSVLDGTTVSTGGFLTEQSYDVPRIDMNGGACTSLTSCDQTKVKYEGVTNFLAQCAGWSHIPTTGRLENFRPLLTPSPEYAYNSTVTRFIHDTNAITYASSREPAPPPYDYFVGGRINGSATQGYVAYLAGHQYLSCQNSDTVVPSERVLDLNFSCNIQDDQLTNPNIVTIEVLLNTPDPANYPALTGSCSCVAGTCPKLSINLANFVENTSAPVCGVYISTDGASYNSVTNTLMNVKIGSNQPYGSGNKTTPDDLNIKSIVVTFPTGTSNSGLASACTTTAAKLTSINDATDPLGCTMCSGPTSTSPYYSATAPLPRRSPASCDPKYEIVYNSAGTPSCSTSTDMTLGPLITSCDVDWTQSTTCGTKYVLNTLVGLQFQLIPNEYSRAGAIQKDNILYKATFEYPGFKGHLYSIDVTQATSNINWDAGKSMAKTDGGMPYAGTGNPSSPAKSNSNRYIFTNVPGTTTPVTMINFDVLSVGTSTAQTNKLWRYLDSSNKMTADDAKALVNAVRGRKGTSATATDGTGETGKRLGGIEHSSPAVMGKSRLAGSSTRDRIVFAGGDDGMLHAFFAGSWDTSSNKYDEGTGREIWAYIPSTLLSSLQNETFTDCSPGETIVGCVASATVSCTCPIFSAAVAVDGASALGDFFVDHDNNPSTAKQWRTILTATAKIMIPGSNVNMDQGIIFALDVTDPYAPTILWERTYNASVSTSDLCTKATGSSCASATNWANNYLHYYPTTSFPDAFKSSETTTFDPNMGDAKGVAIGRVQVGAKEDTYVFVTSKWIRSVANTDSTPIQSYGMSVAALDFYSGNIKWETKLMYTGDAYNVNESPPTPALMDIGNNGTDDYVVFGDMQGRLWLLNTVDGKSISGDNPASMSPLSIVGHGEQEPIGVPVAIYDTKIVFGTGARDSLANQDTTHYHVKAVNIGSKGVVTDLWTYELGFNEKVWSPPVVSNDGELVYVATSIGYIDVGIPSASAGNSGNLYVLKLSNGTLNKDASNNDMKISLGGAAVGDIAVENGHITIQLFNGKTIQIGSPTGGFEPPPGAQPNPVKVLWWRVL